MTPSTGDLPDTGDVIEFAQVPVGSLLVKGTRYRVEHKTGSGEYLLIDTLSGHAGRVSAHELKALKWGVTAEGAAAKEAASPIAKPLTEPKEFTAIPLPPGSTP